ncbi:MAG TPA: D-aminoacylase [Gemmatimonadaceae bacterium]
MTRPLLPLSAAAFALALAACAPAGIPSSAPPAGTVVVNALVADGGGGAPIPAAVRIVGDRIAEVGSVAPREGDRVIDAKGLVLAPGFIDTHSHHDRGLAEHRDATAAVSQGITTIVVGQDGGSRIPLADLFARLEAAPPAVNVASYVGHGSVRGRVLGDDFRREATTEEVERMRALVREEMAAGALGLSTGLEYDPGIYSARSEVLILAREAAAAGGRYISHMRSEDRHFWAALDELIAIGRETGMPVQISHVKLAQRSLWGQADSLLRTLDRARAAGVDVTADIYPYPYWQSTLTVLFPERDFADRAEAEYALREVAAPEGLLLGRYGPEPSYSGKTVAQISEMRGTDPATTLMDLIRLSLEAEAAGGDGDESVVATSMDERDIERIMRWPHTNFCSDGALAGAHPRGYGAYTRVLGRYVRERGVLELGDAVRRMTALAADHVGLAGRGRIAPGYAADLVLFDPATVADVATPASPHEVSRGIVTVWVNGEPVWDAGRPTGRTPGRVLRRLHSVEGTR